MFGDVVAADQHQGERHHCKGADSSGENRRHRAEPRGDKAGAEVAEFVRRADEEHVDRAHAAAHVIGRAELDDGGAHEDADHVRRAHHDKRGDRQRKAGGQAEDQDRDQGDSHAHHGKRGGEHPVETEPIHQ